MSGLPTDREPTREEIDRTRGPLLVEFAATWCGYCQALEPALVALLARYPQVPRIWVEDGKGKPLGRSFKVKLWPTLVFLRDGQVVKQLVRPEPQDVEEGLADLSATSGS